MRKIPGITRKEEEETLRSIIRIADEKLENTRAQVQALADDLHEMLEVFDEKDKEALALWHNADARFTEVNRNLRCAQQARKKPYFGRIDFLDKALDRKEAYYIGRSVIAKDSADPEVIDWRAPIASVYYDAAIGDVSYSVKGEGTYEITLSRKRTYEIENDRLKDFYDSDVVANDELLTRYLAKNKRAVLGEIIATIQQEQNAVIRKKPQHNMIIQGAAGSGKTTVAMHRISYILYNYELEFAPQDFYIIGSNQVLLNYITGVLPDLNVYGVCQMTMEELFVRLLYEDWDKKYVIRKVKRGITPPEKGTYAWFHDLEDFCERYERKVIPLKDVCIEKNGVVLMTREEIEKVLAKSGHLSRADKITRLTEHLIARLENEISGKYYSYTADEKRRLMQHYETYFGKREWKGSIFELYDLFLEEQQAVRGIRAQLPDGEFDVYDLAALAYLYKRIKETEIIREAGHVVIDEAQDFGMMVYGALQYCLSKCTYTIMGDVAQNISMEYGLIDWHDLEKLMLPGKFDYFGLLRKSYRNTVEIAEFATDILYHGSFRTYPIEPIIRHGSAVRTAILNDFDGLLEAAVKTLQDWRGAGLETIAVICADEEEAAKVSAELSARMEITSVCGAKEQSGDMEFGEGVMVLTLEYTKGLEFDAVLIFDASEKNYPGEDGYVRRLYVAATRALHELTVFAQGAMTPLITEPVSREARQRAVLEVSAPAESVLPKEEEILNTELYKRRALEGEDELKLREQYGPRRIKSEGTEKERRSATAGNVHSEKRRMAAGDAKSEKQSAAGASEFGEMPDNAYLRIPGHAKIDCAVRIVMKKDGYFDVAGSYGTLRIAPVTPDTVRICFAKGSKGDFPKPALPVQEKAVRCRVRENAGTWEIATDKLCIRLDKKTGALSFLNAQGKVLLSERAKEPRQIEPGRCFQFFDWKKDEKLFARAEDADAPLLEIGSGAKYISYGGKSLKMPGVASAKGYELLFPASGKVLCCNIPMYGTYVSMEGVSEIEYYFTVKK